MPAKQRKGNKSSSEKSFESDTDMDYDELVRRLTLLEKTVENQSAKITLLESTVALKSATIDTLKTHIDDLEKRITNNGQQEARIEALEQYGRRSNLRIHGVKTADKETDEDVMNIVEEVAEQIGVEFSREDVFRAHRVGKEKKLDNGTASQQIIVKWKTWDARCAFYRARPTPRRPLTLDAGKQQCFSSISMDLTKQRLDLLDSARKKLKENMPNKKGVFAYANINCRLAVDTLHTVS